MKNDVDNEINNDKKYILKPSITNIIKGVYEILNDIINGTLNEELINKFIDCYIVYNKVDTTIIVSPV